MMFIHRLIECYSLMAKLSSVKILKVVTGHQQLIPILQSGHGYITCLINASIESLVLRDIMSVRYHLFNHCYQEGEVKEIISLERRIIASVKAKFDIILHPEVEHI